ncbi:hypothetical protein [Luteolibacter sp. AS25]|uniref:hypothetical protein n=1 Tax=Luteolibacter sp. AS25 TaxID=3135776 RepID=UPI00398AFAEE
MKPNRIYLTTCLIPLFTGGQLLASENLPNRDLIASSSSDPSLDVSLTLGFETLHVYRGADASSGNGIMWETLDIDLYNTFHFNLYGGNSFNDEYKELTPSAYIYHDFGDLTASAGMIWYHLPGSDGADSEEYYFSLAHPLGNGFSVSTWFSYNPRFNGYYNELKVSHTYDFSDNLSLVSYAGLGYSDGLRSGGSGLDNLTVAVGLPIALSEQISIKPLAGYAFALDALESDDEAWLGLNLSYTF